MIMIYRRRLMARLLALDLVNLLERLLVLL
jgi:hypothetical protein